MIGDVIGRSLRQPSRLIPVEALLGNCDGSRMPDIIADRLTPAIAQRLVDVCPTAALGIEEYEGRRCLQAVVRSVHWLRQDAWKLAKEPWSPPSISPGAAWRKSRRCGSGISTAARRLRPLAPSPEDARGANSFSSAEGAEHSPTGCRFLQRMRGGNHRSHEPLLRPGTIRHSFRGVSKTCRHASGDGTGHPQHGRSR